MGYSLETHDIHCFRLIGIPRIASCHQENGDEFRAAGSMTSYLNVWMENASTSTGWRFASWPIIPSFTFRVRIILDNDGMKFGIENVTHTTYKNMNNPHSAVG